MTLQQLHYAIVISETGSMNKAAERLYIAPVSYTHLDVYKRQAITCSAIHSTMPSKMPINASLLSGEQSDGQSACPLSATK